MSQVSPIDRTEIPELLQTLDIDPVFPVHRMSNDRRDLWHGLRHRQLESILSKDAWGYVAKEGGDPHCAIIVQPLPWDTQMLHYPCGRIAAILADSAYPRYEDELLELLKFIDNECSFHELSHISVRVGLTSLPTISALTRTGFEIVDGILTFEKRLTDDIQMTAQKGVDFRLIRAEDVDQVVELAGTAYSMDRFHRDPHVPVTLADELHREWLRNSCRGLGVDAVVVGDVSGSVASFVTCRIDREESEILGEGKGTIVLVATSREVRRQGLAMATTEAALGWFVSQGIRLVEVGTQLANIPASRLYEKAGFRLCNSTITLRRWKS